MSADPFDTINASAKINPLDIDDELNRQEETLNTAFDVAFDTYHKNVELVQDLDEPIQEQRIEEPAEPVIEQKPAWKHSAETKKMKAKSRSKVIDSVKTDEVAVELVDKKPAVKVSVNDVRNKLLENIKDVETKGEYLKIKNIEGFYKGSDEYNEKIGFILKPLFIPSEHAEKFTAADFVRGITSFIDYTPYNSPDITLQHDIASMSVVVNRLGEIFGYKFIDFTEKNQSLSFTNIDVELTRFVQQNAEVPSTVLEYMILTSFLGKLIIALSTSTERAFKSNVKINIDSEFKKAIFNDILRLDKLQNTVNGKLYKSWKCFQEELFGMYKDNNIYVFTDNMTVNEHLSQAYRVTFEVETLLANILKTYSRSIALNYFYVIKSMYYLCRLFGIYIGKRLYEHKSVEEIMSDLKIIANACVGIYETTGHTLKSIPRAVPSVDGEDAMTTQCQTYFFSHLFIGPQYYMLKHFESVFPALANEIVILNDKNQ